MAGPAATPGPRGNMLGAAVGSATLLTKWLPDRAASLAAQLAGTSEGKPPWAGEVRMFGLGNRLVQTLFEKAGVKQQGNLTQDNFKVAAGQMFKQWDTDRNSALNVDEVVDGLRPAFDRTREQALAPPGFAPVRPVRRIGPETMFGRHLFAHIDEDQSMIITGAEWGKAFERWFSAWDANKDRALQTEELDQGFRQVIMMPRFPPGGPHPALQAPFGPRALDRIPRGR